VPNNIISVLWCVSQIQYGRVDIEGPKRRWGFDPLEAFAKTIENPVDRGELIIWKNEIELTSEGMFWANTIGTEMAMEYVYKGKGELVGLEEKTSKIIALFVLLGVKVASLISRWVCQMKKNRKAFYNQKLSD
jgi:hypothetical protein